MLEARLGKARDTVARAMLRWGRFVCRHPWPVLVLVLSLCAILAAQAPRLVVDTSTEGFLRHDDPILVAYDEFRARFGRDDLIVIGIETPDAFTRPFLQRLEEFHAELEAETPFVDEITSLLNARWIRGEEDQLIVEDFVAQWPQTPADLARLRERALSNPLYVDNVVSSDGRLTTVLIEPETYIQDGVDEAGAPVLRYMTGEEQRDTVEAIRAVIARYDGPEFRIHAGGAVWMADRLGYRIMDDLPRLIRSVVTIMALCLFILFGRLRAVLLPLAIVGATVACTIGLMPVLGIPYQVPTQIVPVSLLAIGIGDSIHVLAIYYQRRRAGEAKEEAVAGALGHAGPAILMTSLTTAAALLSFLSAALAPVANVGLLMPIGVMIALGLTVTLLPALLVVLPERSVPSGARLGSLDRLIVFLGTWAVRHPWPTVAGSVFVTLLAVAGATHLRFSHDPIRWFPPGDPLRTATDRLNEKLGGVISVEMLFDTGVDDGVKNLALLHALEAITTENERYTAATHLRDAEGKPVSLRVAKTISIVDLLKEIHRALGGNEADNYILPDERSLVAQELLLFELSGSDDLEDLVDYQYTTARMTVRVPWIDATEYGDFVDGLLAEYRAQVGPDVGLSSTGRIPLLARTLTAVIHSLARSYVLAFAAVTPLMVLLVGRLKLGLLAMIPNLFPIVAALGLMGWSDIPLDGFSLLTGSIALGLAVDDTIHFMHGFRREYEKTQDVEQAVHETLSTTGQALFFTTLILCAGFSVFVTAYMRNAVNFGAITSFALAVAFIADIVLAPALVAILYRSTGVRASRRRHGDSRAAGVL